MGKERKLNIIVFSILCFIYLLLIVFIINGIISGHWQDALFNKVIRNTYFLPTILFCLLDYFCGILFFITCLLYIKKKNLIFYLCSIIVIICMFVSIKFNLPIYWQETSFYKSAWKTDAIEYLYFICYLSTILFLLFYPAFYDCFEKSLKGKKIVLLFTGIIAANINLVKVIDVPSVISLLLFALEVGLLFSTYKLIINSKIMIYETGRKSRFFPLKFIVPIVLVFAMIITRINVEGSSFIISRGAEIDGYWFIGGVSDFIKSFDNPYQGKRSYLTYEFIDKRIADCNEGFEMYYDNDEECYMLLTKERKLEALYYLDDFTEEEANSSNKHSVDISKQYSEEYKTYRVVLSSNRYENMIFYYKVTSEILYNGYEDYIYNPYDRRLEYYDILIDDKEIPAYFLGMVDSFGIVKVEPYLHYWGGNVFEYRTVPNNIRLRTVRQY